jgi:hypothetical protein
MVAVTESLKNIELASPGPSLSPLRVLANLCSSGACPTVYQSDSGTLLVQGYAVSPDRTGLDLPAGESMVEVPAELLAEAVRNLG